jgi:hypothetical protein
MQPKQRHHHEQANHTYSKPRNLNLDQIGAYIPSNAINKTMMAFRIIHPNQNSPHDQIPTTSTTRLHNRSTLACSLVKLDHCKRELSPIHIVTSNTDINILFIFQELHLFTPIIVVHYKFEIP